jgi:hypothetical protein
MQMKILIAVLASLVVTLALPAFFKDCSGNALFVISPGSMTPAALTSAYNNLVNIAQKPCTAPTTVKRTVQKWRSSDGVWHVSDGSEIAGQPDSTVIEIESSLYPKDVPVVKFWVPYAILGFCAGLCVVLYGLILGVEYGLKSFRHEPPANEVTAEYQERKNAGEAVVFAHTTPHEILGIDAKASLEEVEAAYERQLRSFKEQLAPEVHGEEMTPEIKNRFLILRQAYEAMTRKKIDKYLA